MALGPQLRQKPRPSASVFVNWIPRAMFFTRHGRPWSNPTTYHRHTLWPDNLVVVNQNLRFGSHYAVGRLITESQTIPARYVLRRNAFITTYAEQNVDTGTREILIVDPHCPHQWVTWNSTTGDDLPVGAVVGVHLENGVLLYVARAWLTVGLWIIGYYNPETEQAHFWFSKAIETTTMDILVML